MTYKKTFWMNVFFAILWVLFCFVGFAIDIDYEERTVIHKVLSALIQLFILAVPLTTAFYLFKPTSSIRELTLLANYCCIFSAVLFILLTVISHSSIIFSMNFLILLFVYFIFALPFLINLKAIRAS
jgi:hypothetical protein